MWVLDSSHVLVSVRSAGNILMRSQIVRGSQKSLSGFRCRSEEMPESLTSVDSQLFVIEKSCLQGAACKQQDGPQVVLLVNGGKGLMRILASQARIETWLSGLLSEVFRDRRKWRYLGGGGKLQTDENGLKGLNHNSELYLVSPYSNFLM
jgi:hypothetical protein